jgi:hypothetical protein
MLTLARQRDLLFDKAVIAAQLGTIPCANNDST